MLSQSCLKIRCKDGIQDVFEECFLELLVKNGAARHGCLPAKYQKWSIQHNTYYTGHAGNKHALGTWQWILENYKINKYTLIVIDNISNIIEIFKWSYAIILKNNTITIFRKHYAKHEKTGVILGDERVLHTGLHLLLFRRIHGMD